MEPVSRNISSPTSSHLDDEMVDQIKPKLLNALATGNKSLVRSPLKSLKRLRKVSKPKPSSTATNVAPDNETELVEILEDPLDLSDDQFQISEMEFIIDEIPYEEEVEQVPIIDSHKTADEIKHLENKHVLALAELKQSFMERLKRENDIKMAEIEKLKMLLTKNASEIVELEKNKSTMVRQFNTLHESMKTRIAENETMAIEIDLQKNKITQLEKELEAAHELNAQNDQSEQIAALKQEMVSKNATISDDKIEICKIIDLTEQQTMVINQQTIQIQTQKMRIDELERKQQQHQLNSASSSVSTTSTLAPEVNKSKPTEKLPQMSKPVLFNGIKRYLNASMVALLRIEMFGEAEREYKPDEREIAMQLMKLPPSDAQPGCIYEYMRSEWRFRLPPRNSVLQWIKEREDNANNMEEEWDDC